jgi:LPS sulfotransferase NodH
MSPEFRQYFEPLIQRNNKNGTWGVEIDARRYHWLLDLMDLDDALRSDAGIPVIWLTRQDIVSQAYSLAKARLSRKWHVYADGPFQKFAKMMRRLRFFPLSKNGEANLMVEPREKSFREIPSSVDDKAIWAQVFYILKWEQEIERKFCQNNFNPLRITYEQLICDQAITLVRTFAHLGFDEADIHIGVAKACSTNNPTIKMHYPDKIHQLTSFYTRYAKIIDAIQANRTDISEETIKTLISVSNEGTNHVK